VYGHPRSVPIREDSPLSPTNPYGQTKLMIEQMLLDQCAANLGWRVASLRYFNPVGAHESGMIGEDPLGIPNNLMPVVAQVASGDRLRLEVFGTDYATPDGTALRDYVHVNDLAEGHVAAIKYLLEGGGTITVNLGTGRAHSVLEVIREFERVVGRRLPWAATARRPGDVEACWADVTRAAEVLGWRAERSLESMVVDAWRWYATR
jgi:UDP-glucose 4-epimerase